MLPIFPLCSRRHSLAGLKSAEDLTPAVWFRIIFRVSFVLSCDVAFIGVHLTREFSIFSKAFSLATVLRKAFAF